MSTYENLLRDIREIRAQQSGANTEVAAQAADYLNGLLANGESPVADIDPMVMSRILVTVTGILMMIGDDIDVAVDEEADDPEGEVSILFTGFDIAVDAMIGIACAAAANVDPISAADLTPDMFK